MDHQTEQEPRFYDPYPSGESVPVEASARTYLRSIGIPKKDTMTEQAALLHLIGSHRTLVKGSQSDSQRLIQVHRELHAMQGQRDQALTILHELAIKGRQVGRFRRLICRLFRIPLYRGE